MSAKTAGANQAGLVGEETSARDHARRAFTIARLKCVRAVAGTHDERSRSLRSKIPGPASAGPREHERGEAEGDDKGIRPVEAWEQDRELIEEEAREGRREHKNTPSDDRAQRHARS